MRLIARFAKEEDNCFEIITVYDERVVKERINKETPILVSITKEYPTAVWFERKLSDEFGIEILYSNDKRPLIKHEHFPKDTYPMRKEFSRLSLEYSEPINEPLTQNSSRVINPVDSCHLESAQFKLFDRDGDILHFETIAFYKYRAIEKMLEGMRLDEAQPIIERISGTSTIAYQLAYLEIALEASKRVLPDSLKIKNIFFLEFERVINHLWDLGVICESLNFKEGYSFFMKLVEYGRETMSDLTGNRFGFDVINMESCRLELERGYKFVRHLEKELLWFEEWIDKKAVFWKKLRNKGTLSKDDILKLGLVGIVARSINIDLDRREESRLYREYGFVPALEEAGDSSSRFKIRLTEIHTSIRIMRRVLDNRVLPFFLGSFSDGEYYSYIESSFGELMMYIEIKDEKIERFFVRDPSFLNTQALSHLLKGNEIESLELIIKTIPLSFSANDL